MPFILNIINKQINMDLLYSDLEINMHVSKTSFRTATAATMHFLLNLHCVEITVPILRQPLGKS